MRVESSGSTESSDRGAPSARKRGGAAHACPACAGRGRLSVFYEVRDVPVHSCLLRASREAALAFPRGDIRLAVCADCGFITNLAFDPGRAAYAPDYEDQQSFSPTFNAFAATLVDRLIEEHDLRGKQVVEIGCSKGDFLLAICERGPNRGVGIDPSALPGRVASEAAGRVRFVAEHYSARHAGHVADFVCCRHTLEHLPDVAAFLRLLRGNLGERIHTGVFFEVPDASRILEDCAFEDIYYEHCSYFTPGALARLFRGCGFEVLDVYRGYGDQYLMLEARPAGARPESAHPMEEPVAEVVTQTQRFAGAVDARLDSWRTELEGMHRRGERVAVWGSGSKCVAFLTTLDAVDCVDCVVDVNPHRHGRFIPGLGTPIMPPEHLRVRRPDRVIAMNPIYTDEIATKLRGMGVPATLTSL